MLFRSVLAIRRQFIDIASQVPEAVAVQRKGKGNVGESVLILAILHDRGQAPSDVFLYLRAASVAHPFTFDLVNGLSRFIDEFIVFIVAVFPPVAQCRHGQTRHLLGRTAKAMLRELATE